MKPGILKQPGKTILIWNGKKAITLKAYFLGLVIETFPEPSIEPKVEGINFFWFPE